MSSAAERLSQGERLSLKRSTFIVMAVSATRVQIQICLNAVFIKQCQHAQKKEEGLTEFQIAF